MNRLDLNASGGTWIDLGPEEPGGTSSAFIVVEAYRSEGKRIDN